MHDFKIEKSNLLEVYTSVLKIKVIQNFFFKWKEY